MGWAQQARALKQSLKLPPSALDPLLLLQARLEQLDPPRAYQYEPKHHLDLLGAHAPAPKENQSRCCAALSQHHAP